MALVLKKETLPGYKTFKKIYDLIPGGGTVKKVIVGVTIGAVIVGAIAAGAIGIAALCGAIGGSIFGGALLSAGVIAALPFVFNFLGQSIQRVYSFNWNVSDTEIDAALQSSISSLYGQLGEAAGQAVGWLVCGILPATLTFMFNPGVARMVMADMTEEARDEVWGSLAACKSTAVSMLGNAMVANGFKSARRWLKRPDNPFYGFLKDHFGENFTKWGDANRPSWSFASEVDNRVEQIADPNWRNFTEEFVDGLMDGCSEALQNLGQSMRQAMAAYAAVRKQEQQAQSKQMVVELDFSRNNDDENPQPATP